MKHTDSSTAGLGLMTVALAIVVASLLTHFAPNSPAGANSMNSMPTHNQTDHQAVVKNGRLPGYENAEINTDKDAFLYLMNVNIVFDRPNAPGNVMLENTPGNIYQMDVEFALRDSAEIVYRSARLDPGQHVTMDHLDLLLDPGTYEALATVRVYRSYTDDIVRTYLEQVTLTVNNRLI